MNVKIAIINLYVGTLGRLQGVNGSICINQDYSLWHPSISFQNPNMDNMQEQTNKVPRAFDLLPSWYAPLVYYKNISTCYNSIINKMYKSCICNKF